VKKGQPEGPALNSRAGKPWVAGTDRKTWNAAGQNNSNPTPIAASVAKGEWELLLANSSHYCFVKLEDPRFLHHHHPVVLSLIFDNKPS